MSENTPPEDQMTAAIGAAIQTAVDAMTAMPPRRAFVLATQLRDLLGITYRAEMETQRAIHVRRIWKDEELELAVLGASLDVPLSGQRVSQMIAKAKAVAPAPRWNPADAAT